MTEIEKQILHNQTVIMDVLTENALHLSTFAKRDLSNSRIDTLRLIKREEEKEKRGREENATND